MSKAEGQSSPPIGDTMSRRYVAILAGASIVVLLIGSAMRDRLSRSRAPAPAPPSEASALQQLSQEGELRRRADFVAERVAEVERWVEWLPDVHASGTHWPPLQGLVTSSPHRAVVVHTLPPGVGGGMPPVLAGGTSTRGWVYLVAKTVHAGVVSAPAIIGGVLSIDCNGEATSAYVLNVPLTDPFAGAAVFDLERRLAGLVVRCGATLAAIPAEEVTRLGAASRTSAARLLATSGLTIASSRASVTSGAPSLDSGLAVQAVRVGSAAYRAGILPGDVLLTIDGHPVADADGIGRALADSTVAHRVTRRRGRATGTTTIPTELVADENEASADRGVLGIDISPARRRGVLITGVIPGSAADRAGLRNGDLLVRVGASEVSDARSARRALERAARDSAFIVFERDSVLHGAMVRR